MEYNLRSWTVREELVEEDDEDCSHGHQHLQRKKIIYIVSDDVDDYDPSTSSSTENALEKGDDNLENASLKQRLLKARTYQVEHQAELPRG